MTENRACWRERLQTTGAKACTKMADIIRKGANMMTETGAVYPLTLVMEATCTLTYGAPNIYSTTPHTSQQNICAGFTTDQFSSLRQLCRRLLSHSPPRPKKNIFCRYPNRITNRHHTMSSSLDQLKATGTVSY